MNKFLVLIIVLLIPFAIRNNDNGQEVVFQNDLIKYSLELPIKEDSTSNAKVLISLNKDKSNPFYLNLEDYIVGVVAGEMPASFDMEALKAQAVAARSYAVYKMKNKEGYVLATNVNDQVYLTEEEMKEKWKDSYDYYLERVIKAVSDTKGEVLTYDGEVIIAYYFAISNGYTDSSEAVFNQSLDYLKGVDSSWDKNYQAYKSTREMSKSSFCEKLSINCENISITNLIRGDNHYVKSITINGKTFRGREVFSKLSLKSHDFEINVNGDKVLITTLGFGHGVGLSQYGALGMAKEGYSYQDILKHYYQNTEIEKMQV